jgi:hypothetical protein
MNTQGFSEETPRVSGALGLERTVWAKSDVYLDDGRLQVYLRTQFFGELSTSSTSATPRRNTCDHGL